MPQVINEQNVFLTFERKAKTIRLYFQSEGRFPQDHLRVSTLSACHLSQLPNNSVDYVFTDPPFGGNINYSEMNFLWESWLGTFTDHTEEAIVNRCQGKGNDAYGNLMRDAIREIRRVLKPGGWLTLMFHNSSATVWDELQRAIFQAGFSIDGAMVFDKRHGTFKQFVSENAVGFDLVLSCQKKGTAGAAVPQTDRETEERAIRLFARKQLAGHGRQSYVSHYEHVRRSDEFNYRKLYSEWLANVVGSEYIVTDFELFRLIAQDALKDMKGMV